MTSGTHATEISALVELVEASGLPFKSRLAKRVEAISEEFAEDYQAPVSKRSLAACIDFLRSGAFPAYPDITLTPRGDFYAEWRGKERREVAIEFRDAGDARYVMTRPNPRHPDRTDTLVGVTTTDSLVDAVRPLAPWTGIAA